MHIEEAMQKAVNRLDWAAVNKRLITVAPEDLEDWVANFLNVILRDGYLILRRPDVKKRARRDSFVNELRSFLTAHGLKELIDERDDEFSGQSHIEIAYHEILNTFDEKVLINLSPTEMVWAALRFADKYFRDARTRMFASPPDPNQIFDPVTAKLPVDQDGTLAHPDDVLNAIQGTLTSTLKMLSYSNGWFQDDGTLILPTIVPTTEEHSRIAGGTAYLAAIWRRLELSEGAYRYFGGTVVREEAQLQEQDGTIRTGDTIKIEFSKAREIELRIAGERLRRMIFNFEVELQRDPRAHASVVDTLPLPAAPEAYVSFEEAHAALTLSHMIFRSVFDITRDLAGLTLAQWLRGYSVIRKLASAHLAAEATTEGVTIVQESDILSSLVSHGLPEDKAKIFFDHICFKQDSSDVFDAPLLRCEGDRLCFVVVGAAFLHIPFTIMSQLSSLGCNMTWKGNPFEESVVKLFRDHGVAASGIRRTIDGSQIQIDCVALWDDVLFVIEDKNYSLPGDNAQQEYWFLHDQADAASQVQRKVEAVEAHPELVWDALGDRVTWKRIVPIVLNGTLFSLTGDIDGVHFFDSSALRRFLEDGFLTLSAERGGGDGPTPIRPGLTRLWSGERPNAEDLIRQLERPAQVVQAAHFWGRRWQAMPLSDRLSFATILVERIPTTPELLARSIGIEEADLRAGIEEIRVREG